MKRFLIIAAATALLFSCSKPAAVDGGSTPQSEQGDAGQTQVPKAPAPGDQDQSGGPVAQPGEAAAATPDPAAAGGDAATTVPDSSSPQAPSATTQPQRIVGEVVYTEGSVSVQRAGGSRQAIDIGDVVNRYDVIMTGPGSRAEVDLGAGRPGGASIKLAENTVFYFDTRELEDKSRKTLLQLLGGSIAVKVDKLASGSFNVAAEETVMGVRGTVFYVDTVPDGSVLLSCFEGSVAVQTDSAKALAQPGQAIARSSGTSLATSSPGVAALSSYRQSWQSQSFETFARQAMMLIDQYASILDKRRAAFDVAYTALLGQASTLEMWRGVRASGKTPRFTDWRDEKRAVAAVLFDCLEGLFLIERPYYKLQTMKTLHEQGMGVGSLKDGRTSASFFASFDAVNRGLPEQLAAVREALDLFSWAAAGSPLADFFGSKAERLGSGQLFLGDDEW